MRDALREPQLADRGHPRLVEEERLAALEAAVLLVVRVEPRPARLLLIL